MTILSFVTLPEFRCRECLDILTFDPMTGLDEIKHGVARYDHPPHMTCASSGKSFKIRLPLIAGSEYDPHAP